MSSVLLENLKEAIDLEKIDESQALYLIYLKENLVYDGIEPEDLLHLTTLGYLRNGKLTKKVLSQDGVKDVISGTIKPKYFNDVSSQIPKKLIKILGNKAEDGSLKLLGGDESINDTARKYLAKEGLIAYHFLTFLFIFPIQGETNKRWEKHFTRFPYKGAKLRTRSRRTGKNFVKIVKSKDMGAFLYGTYLYMKSCIRENKAYVKTIPNYLEEYEDWYLMAYEAIDKAESVDELFKDNMAREGRLGVAL